MFYNGLTRFDSHLVPQMELAERIESDDANSVDRNVAQGRYVSQRQTADTCRRGLLAESP